LKKNELVKKIAKLETFIKKQTVTEHRQIEENGILKRELRHLELVAVYRENEIKRCDKFLSLLTNNK